MTYYAGGAINGENAGLGGGDECIHPLPPDPPLVGECWRDMWLDRLGICRTGLIPGHLSAARRVLAAWFGLREL